MDASDVFDCFLVSLFLFGFIVIILYGFCIPKK
jgi:hypothetical protein